MKKHNSIEYHDFRNIILYSSEMVQYKNAYGNYKYYCFEMYYLLNVRIGKTYYFENIR